MSKINEILNSNQELLNYISGSEVISHNFMGILKNIENIIPEECRTNLYKNLETLRMTTSTQQGSFSSIDCTHINLDGKTLFAAEYSNDKEKFLNIFLSEMYHELLHVASTTIKVDLEAQTIKGKSGFSKYKYDELNSQAYEDENEYNGLTEGFTQFLTFNNFSENSSSYDTQIGAIKQLIDLAGIDACKKAYFDNRNGLDPIINELEKKGIDPKIIDELEESCHLDLRYGTKHNDDEKEER